MVIWICRKGKYENEIYGWCVTPNKERNYAGIHMKMYWISYSCTKSNYMLNKVYILQMQIMHHFCTDWKHYYRIKVHDCPSHILLHQAMASLIILYLGLRNWWSYGPNSFDIPILSIFGSLSQHLFSIRKNGWRDRRRMYFLWDRTTSLILKESKNWSSVEQSS